MRLIRYRADAEQDEAFRPRQDGVELGRPALAIAGDPGLRHRQPHQREGAEIEQGRG